MPRSREISAELRQKAVDGQCFRHVLVRPDLNPIEMLWKSPKRAVHAKKPTNITESHQAPKAKVHILFPTNINDFA